MKRQHDNDFDRLIADKLGNFRAEPPEVVWRAVATGIGSGTATSSVWSSIAKPIIWSLSVVSTAFILSTNSPTTDISTVSEQTVQSVHQISHLPNLVQADNLIDQNTFIPSNNRSVAKVNPVPPNYSTLPAIVEKSKPEQLFSDNTSNSISDFDVIAPTLPMPSKEAGTIATIPPACLPPISSGLLTTSAPPDYVRTPWLYLSLNTGSDVFSLNNNINLESWGSNIGLGISVHMSEFYFMTGLNYLNISQKNKYLYTTNEFKHIGDYVAVDSISFITLHDSTGNPYQSPVYYTSNRPYYDSVEVNYDTYSFDHYHFFEIPMIIGLQKDVKHFTLYAQTGFTYTFSLSSKELSREHFESISGTHTQSWSPLSEQRLDNFWSFTFAMGAYYNTRRNISFGIEPTYRYYLDPFFTGTQSNRQTPVSYGIRLRLLYKL